MVEELIAPEQEGFSPEELEDLATYPPEPEREEKGPTQEFSIKIMLEVINHIESAIGSAMQNDPIMTRSINFKRQCEQALQVYEELYTDHLRRARQSRLTDISKSDPPKIEINCCNK